MKWQVWHKRSDDYNQDENGMMTTKNTSETTFAATSGSR